MPRQDAERALLDLMPQTSEETEQAEQAADEVAASPELGEKLRRVVSRVNWAGVARELSPWAALYLPYRLLMETANFPVTEQLSAEQNAAVQNKLVVLSIVVALAAIIISTRRS